MSAYRARSRRRSFRQATVRSLSDMSPRYSALYALDGGVDGPGGAGVSSSRFATGDSPLLKAISGPGAIGMALGTDNASLYVVLVAVIISMSPDGHIGSNSRAHPGGIDAAGGGGELVVQILSRLLAIDNGEVASVDEEFVRHPD